MSFREDSFINFVQRNVSLLLAVSVKMEITSIDFLQASLEQKLLENIMITSEKIICDRYSLCSTFITIRKNDAQSMFWPRPICPGHADQDLNQGIILEVDVFCSFSRR